MGTPLHPERRRYLETLFPGLIGSRYAVLAGPSKDYNCIGWAMGSTSDWWWPEIYSLWPIRERRETVSCFIKLLMSEGFEAVPDAVEVAGYRKIALYAHHGRPTHMARVESAVVWSSKVGRDELIEHEPNALNGDEYGAPVIYFPKKI